MRNDGDCSEGEAMILSIVILVLLSALGLGFVGSPLLGRGRAGRAEEEASVVFEHETALRLLRDLEHDRQTGKVDHEEYLREKERMEARGIAALKRLDAVHATSSTPSRTAGAAKRDKNSTEGGR